MPFRNNFSHGLSNLQALPENIGSNSSQKSSRRDKRADFVNAPAEYSDRARDEIRRRLLQPNGTGLTPVTTNSSSRSKQLFSSSHTQTATHNNSNNNTTRLSLSNSGNTSYIDAALDNSDTRSLHSNATSLNSSQTAHSFHSLQSNAHSIPSFSTHNDTLDSRSVFSDNASSYQSSIFSNPSNSGVSNITNFTINSSTNNSIPPSKFIKELSLEDALPKTFYDMYSPDILMSDPSNLFFNGRPKFTKRELLDWDLNDIRSLLIIEKLKPEWGNNLPTITTFNHPELPVFKFQLLPLNSTDEFIIKTLVESDLYLEANLDFEFKLTSAKYTVKSARSRHEQLTGENNQIMNLSKPEWRNIIENYLLNIAVEAQCRFDFKQKCSEFKKFKSLQLSASLQQQKEQQQQQQQQQLQHDQINLRKPNMPPPRIIPTNQSQQHFNSNGDTNSKSLLKKTLIKNLQMKNGSNGHHNSNNPFDTTNDENSHNNTTNIPTKITLTKQEKTLLWSQCQAQVYQRLGLDWKPDNVV
ncbi:hypothetical protein TBLA_0A09490 [Henningerozyma blattae CBS 6284]|uniref:Protein MTH1 n=1 Tax=Henningerozyma blattae (strain ATCC 34711 / CBS 6284 / DSM 70876 / NBRC 10599 / NRRL Y-10934 / UCD 77-7) TaxID=1071380 RepID=I2GX82_HENB6|nr:hypothetical protein TBLA_0A09490 [Tetrapisispora blattae CBS 6284]CCH58734.1 hypothetical protein TBLA_0A09490 [Tetrapisispora blattae CBS 6284]